MGELTVAIKRLKFGQRISEPWRKYASFDLEFRVDGNPFLAVRFCRAWLTPAGDLEVKGPTMVLGGNNVPMVSFTGILEGVALAELARLGVREELDSPEFREAMAGMFVDAVLEAGAIVAEKKSGGEN